MHDKPSFADQSWTRQARPLVWKRQVRGRVRKIGFCRPLLWESQAGGHCVHKISCCRPPVWNRQVRGRCAQKIWFCRHPVWKRQARDHCVHSPRTGSRRTWQATHKKHNPRTARYTLSSRDCCGKSPSRPHNPRIAQSNLRTVLANCGTPVTGRRTNRTDNADIVLERLLWQADRPIHGQPEPICRTLSSRDCCGRPRSRPPNPRTARTNPPHIVLEGLQLQAAEPSAHRRLPSADRRWHFSLVACAGAYARAFFKKQNPSQAVMRSMSRSKSKRGSKSRGKNKSNSRSKSRSRSKIKSKHVSKNKTKNISKNKSRSRSRSKRSRKSRSKSRSRSKRSRKNTKPGAKGKPWAKVLGKTRGPVRPSSTTC